MSDDEARKSLYSKIASVQKNVASVTLRRGDGDDPITFAAAADVNAVIHPELRKRGLLTLPSVYSSGPIKGGTQVRLQVAVIDKRTTERCEVFWDGEGVGERALGQAITNALKSFYIGFFQIPTVEPPGARHQPPRHETPLVTEGQIERFREVQQVAEVSDERFDELLREDFKAEAVEDVPYHRAGEVVAALQRLAPPKAEKVEEPAEA